LGQSELSATYPKNTFRDNRIHRTPLGQVHRGLYNQDPASLTSTAAILSLNLGPDIIIQADNSLSFIIRPVSIVTTDKPPGTFNMLQKLVDLPKCSQSAKRLADQPQNLGQLHCLCGAKSWILDVEA